MINNCVIMGRLVADTELKTTQSGIEVCSFTVAVERSFVKAGEEKQTDFLDCVAWRKTAAFVSKYFHKGDMIALTGEIQTRTYEDKENKKRKVVEIVVKDVSFCGSKSIKAEPAEETSGNDFVDAVDDDPPF